MNITVNATVAQSEHTNFVGQSVLRREDARITRPMAIAFLGRVRAVSRATPAAARPCDSPTTAKAR
jgi:hypothetical protein